VTSDGQLAVIGVGSVGSMALWEASKLGVDPVGFEAAQDFKSSVPLLPRHKDVIMEVAGNKVGTDPPVRQRTGDRRGEADRGER